MANVYYLVNDQVSKEAHWTRAEVMSKQPRFYSERKPTVLPKRYIGYILADTTDPKLDFKDEELGSKIVTSNSTTRNAFFNIQSNGNNN